jgi:hypothetical protein
MATVKVNWLNAETVVGTDTDAEEVTGASKLGVQVVTTGSPASFAVELQGSIDGANWVTLVTATNSAINGYGQGAAQGPAQFIRLHLASLSGGTSPTVSASVVAV